jgi:hypothetical protein
MTATCRRLRSKGHATSIMASPVLTLTPSAYWEVDSGGALKARGESRYAHGCSGVLGPNLSSPFPILKEYGSFVPSMHVCYKREGFIIVFWTE